MSAESFAKDSQAARGVFEHAAVCRTTVARMLARQAHDEHNPAQFIVTTFHPQVLILISHRKP